MLFAHPETHPRGFGVREPIIALSGTVYIPRGILDLPAPHAMILCLVRLRRFRLPRAQREVAIEIMRIHLGLIGSTFGYTIG
jgi:hypothetical protein